MSEKHLIPAEECCTHYNIDLRFIRSLNELELIGITVEEERIFIDESQLSELEKYIRLHYELDINMEGLEAIAHLLRRVSEMQQQIANLQSRLGLYEPL